MPRVPSDMYFPYSQHRDGSSPYRNNSLQLPVPNARSSPSPSTYSHRSSHYASSSTASPPRALSPLPAQSHQPLKAPASTWTAQGELYPYIKGKKVTNSQLNHLLAHFAENENPSKEQRLALANQLCMSFKALSIWFQNERANVKKGRSRTAQHLEPSPSPLAAQPPSPPETHHHHPLPTPPSSVSKPPPSSYYRSHPLPPPPTTFISSRRPLPLALRPVAARLSPPPASSPISSRGGLPSPYPTSEYYYDEDREPIDSDDEMESEDGSSNRTAVDFESPASESHRLPEVRVHHEPIIVDEQDEEDEIVEIENPHRRMDIVEWEAATILAGLKGGSH
ncbi:hypothetical protein M407DRAFT_229412 [Tulasnella calospora MUT 4182]|uniref:Homeobox domain-containing protein n=1 Tax=Tulasnella calospora MUT 4182 TaxID=1051891 RepID=A0A0C3QNS9_9AGAM|nr:hypothetical protein M407DRAFT_229412 [Tulasnella calospora MUT 4182]